MTLTERLPNRVLSLALPLLCLSPALAWGQWAVGDGFAPAGENRGWYGGGDSAQLHWDEAEMRYRPLQSAQDGSASLRLETSRQAIDVGSMGHWQFGVDLDALVSPPVADTPHATGRGQDLGGDKEPAPALELDAFLLSGQSQGLSVNLGRHRPVSQGLLFAGGVHWGLSAGAQLDEINSEFALFGVNGVAATKDPMAGFGLAGESDYYGGGTWQSSLNTPWSSAITVSAGYVAGRDSRSLPLTLDEYEPGPGLYAGSSEGYSLGLDSRWFRNRLQLSMETAVSHFEPEIPELSERISDRAYRASLVLTPGLEWLPRDWQVGAHAQDVGLQFLSPGNQAMVQDRSQERVFMRFKPMPGWSVGYSLRREAPSRADAGDGLLGDEVFASGTLHLNPRLELTPAGEFQRERCRDSSTRVTHRLLSLTASTWLIPQRLSYRNSIELSRTERSEHSPLASMEEHRAVAGVLNWLAISPGRKRPGLDVNLSFSADRYHSSMPQTALQNEYRVELSVNSRLPGS